MSSILKLFGISSNTKDTSLKEKQQTQNKKAATVQMTSCQKSAAKFAREYLVSKDIAEWIEEKDKKCTDGCDDGKISLKDGIVNGVKGFFGGVIKEVLKHPVATAVTIASGAVLTIATGGAALPVLTAVGATASTAAIGYGVYKVSSAKTDAEAKQACETIGMGVFGLVASAAGAKGALDKAARAGVTSAREAKDLGSFKALVQCFKSAPEAIKVSGQNIVKTAKTISVGVKLAISENSASYKASQNLEQEKTFLEYKIENNLKISTELSPNSAKYQDKTLQEKLIKSINNDNIDLAKDLINNHKENGMINSNYVVERDAYSEYLLKTVPKVLEDKDPMVHRAAKYIIDCKDIPDKFHALKILKSSNAQEIMDLKPTYSVAQNRVLSIQELLWEKYPNYVEPPRILPYVAENTGALQDISSGENFFCMKVYGQKGKIPNVPGAYLEDGWSTPHYVVYEERGKDITFWDVMDKANSLIDKYGYKN